MKPNTNCAIRAGIPKGIIIDVNIFSFPQPSILAAASISSGIPLKYSRKNITVPTVPKHPGMSIGMESPEPLVQP